MDLATLVPLGLKASVAILVFGLGLSATFADAFYLFRKPWQLIRSLFAMNIVMPLVAAALAVVFDLHPAVKIALVALAVSPVPPILPRKQGKAGGREAYAIGLLVAAGLLAIVFVPIAVELLGRGFATTAHISSVEVARLVLMTVFGPLLTGIVFRFFAPAFAERIAQPISLIATLLLFLCAVAVLFSAWPAIVSLIGNFTIVALAVFVIIGLFTGYLLGGPGAEDRRVLALASAARHPGVALAIATANFPAQKLAPAAILLYLILSAVLSIPYVMWGKRHAEISNTIETAKES
jgi:bile acid:Na+ symporter, BASS family